MRVFAIYKNLQLHMINIDPDEDPVAIKYRLPSNNALRRFSKIQLLLSLIIFFTFY